MTKQIKFEGQIHAFPDDATDEEINQALGGSNEPINNNQNPTNLPDWLFHGLSSLSNKINPDFLEKAGDIAGDFNKKIEGIPETAGKFVGDLPQNISESASQFAKNPLRASHRASANIISSLLEGGKGLYNAPLNLQTYLGSKGIPGFKEGAPLAEALKIGDTGLEKAVLGNEEPGDILWKKLPMLYPGLNLTKNIASKGIDIAKKSPQLIEKAGDILPITKRIASNPYVKQTKALEEKGLLTGYKPNVPDVLEASRILRSKGMKIPHEAVNEAVAQTLEGNYKPWFDLQSSIRSEARRLSKMGGVNRTLGEKLHGMAEKMHNEIGEAQASRGAPEAEKLMHQGKARTARYHKISPVAKIATGAAAAAAAPAWIANMIRSLSK